MIQSETPSTTMDSVATPQPQPPPSSSSSSSSEIDQTTSLQLRKIEFHLARKPPTYTPKSSTNPNFKLITLNPISDSNHTHNAAASSSSSAAAHHKKAAEPSDFFEEGILAFRTPFRRIGAGLENLGNTCFLNSVVQCLTYTEPLVAYLQSGKHQSTCCVAGFCALCAVQKHVSRALQSSGRILAPKDLVSNLRCISRNFRNARQEDAHEYMIHLLESMHKCCLPSGVPAESPGAYEKSLVHKIFGGRLRSQVKCLQCSYCSNTFDPFLDLSLEIIKADSLFKALKHFTAPEQLDGGERQYKCERCKQKVRALKQLTVSKAPYILTVHLKRFRSFSGQKIDKKVQFGATLDLKPFVTGGYEGDLSYTLYGVLVHAGWSTHSGHYYCFVRTSNGLWYSLDDNRVRPVSERTVMEQKAYMLFYVRDRKNFAPKKAMDIMQKETLITAMRNASNSCSVPGASSFLKEASNANSREAILSGSVAIKCKASDAFIQSGPPNPAAPTDHSVKPGSNEKRNDKISSESKSALHSELSMKQELDKKLDNGMSSKAVPIKDNCFLKKDDDDIHAGRSAQVIGPVVSCDSNGQFRNSGSDFLLSGNKPSNLECLSSVNGMYNKSSNTANGEVEDKSNFFSNIKKQENAASGTSKDSRVRMSRSKESAIDGSVSVKTREIAPLRVQKKIFKSRGVGMHLSSKILYGASLKWRKSKKCKKVKLQMQKNSLQVPVSSDAGPSTSTGISCSLDSCSDSGMKVDNLCFEKGGNVDTRKCAINSKSSVLSMNSDVIRANTSGERSASERQHSVLQNGLSNGGTSVFEETAVAQWEGIDFASANVEANGPEVVTVGHILDEWDEEYDRGKRKKVREVKNDFDGPNLFQEVASKKAKLKAAKKGQSIHVNEPFRI